VDVQRDSLAALSRVVVVDSEVPESGWISIDLGRHGPGRIEWAGPNADWETTREPCWRAEAQVSGVGPNRRRRFTGQEPLTISRLEAWAELLRGREKLPAAHDAVAPPRSEAAERLRDPEKPPAGEVVLPTGPKPPKRGIRPEDLVAVGKKPAAPPPAEPRPLVEPGLPVVPKPLIARPKLRIVAGRPRFHFGAVPSSPGIRFILLCLAAFFLSAGAMHSFARWKQTRVIVVPTTVTPGSVIT
jgi:hypothetical protein